jgi:hypothetical protein
MKARVGVILAASILGPLLALAPSRVVEAETAHIFVRVETQGKTGEQVTRFWAFTTSDEAGKTPLEVSRLCVKGVGHREEEKCVENASAVELVEQATGLPGVGNRCVEAFASAMWGTVPLNATARVCP